jgi:small conductance mechanosensitive channel
VITRWWNAIDPTVATLIIKIVSLGATLLLLLLAYSVAIRLIDRVLARHTGEGRTWQQAQRARTVGQLLTNVARWVVLFIAIVMVLREFGVDVEALLVSAGVLGLAIGFGAQTFIRDVIAGFFLLFEGLVAVGDIVEVGTSVGAIESIGLRVTTIRLRNGALRVVPNGQLSEFTRYGRGQGRALVDVSLARGTDPARAASVLERANAGWRVEQAPGSLTLIIQVAPGSPPEPDTELTQRITQAFERDGLPLPAVRRVRYEFGEPAAPGPR